jgi:hypothetical protein
LQSCRVSFGPQAATDYNLLRELSNNVSFAPSSDLAQIIPVSAFLYGMAMLGFISYGLYLCIWTKKSNDPETATAEYFRQATLINVIFVRARLDS